MNVLPCAVVLHILMEDSVVLLLESEKIKETYSFIFENFLGHC